MYPRKLFRPSPDALERRHFATIISSTEAATHPVPPMKRCSSAEPTGRPTEEAATEQRRLSELLAMNNVKVCSRQHTKLSRPPPLTNAGRKRGAGRVMAMWVAH